MSSLRSIGAGFHGGVDLVAGAVEEAGVDEDDAVLRGADAGLEIDGGAALLVHDAHLDGVARQAQSVLDPVEQVVGEGHFLRPVHLGLHDIDASRCGCCGVALPRFRSCSAISVVNSASSMPSGTSLPS